MQEHDPHAHSVAQWKQPVIAIGLALIATIAILILLTQMVTDTPRVAKDDEAAVLSRIKPVGEVELAVASGPKGQLTGEQVYNQVCKTCHEGGLAGAPKVGDKAAWGKVIAQGLATTVDHAVPECTSRETFMGVLAGRSRGVWNGAVVIRPGAQKSDARQSNRNLLLSSDATVNSKPELMIFADDVKCGHGATVGQLDPAALFYLRARGLDEPAARALLTHAFVRGVAERIGPAAVRADVDGWLAARMQGLAT